MTQVMEEIFIITFTQLYTEFHINWLVPVLKSKCHVIKDKIMESVCFFGQTILYVASS